MSKSSNKNRRLELRRVRELIHRGMVAFANGKRREEAPPYPDNAHWLRGYDAAAWDAGRPVMMTDIAAELSLNV